QGGTWPFDRAGWCPGTKVDEYDFELTKIVNPGDTILFDYGIEAYKDNGEKDGEFRMSHQLISYGPPNFELDARVEEIIAPSLNDSYSRINPICDNPVIVIKNTGKYPLKTLGVFFRIKGQDAIEYQWNGNLEFMEKEEVFLPQPDWAKAKENDVFEVWIENPNGSEDEYSANNYLSSAFKTAPVLPEEFVLYIETNDNGRAKENSYYISDDMGEILFKREIFDDSVTYQDKIKLESGCFEFRLTDDMQDGMNRHWWLRNSNPEMIGRNGKIEIRNTEGEVLHTFAYDFGQELLYRFRVR
ncbi:peptide-N-glycosidase F-related protein, partial [Bacteroidota bacterium]